MPFVRLDPAWVRSPKVNRLSRLDRLAWIELLSWCVENRTNGAGSAQDLRRIWTDVRAGSRDRTMRNLQEAGLVLPDPDRGPDAWVVHDFLVYQTSKEEDEERRLANRERQRRHRERHGQPSGAQNRKRYPKGGSNAVTEGGNNGVTRGGSNAPLTSPPSLTGGEEGKSTTRRAVAARPTGGRSSTSREGTMADSAELAKQLVARLEKDTDA